MDFVNTMYVDNAYVRITESELLEGSDKQVGYIDVIDALTISEENKLRRENQTLKVSNYQI
jgi:hypothetical protein